MPGGHEHYLKSKPKPKWPVGKVAGVDSHTYNGSHVIHILIEYVVTDPKGGDVVEWRLRCNPAKKGVYSFMGFRAAITCARCKKRGVPNEAE